jgi:hypothetical protein
VRCGYKGQNEDDARRQHAYRAKTMALVHDDRLYYNAVIIILCVERSYHGILVTFSSPCRVGTKVRPRVASAIPTQGWDVSTRRSSGNVDC